MTDTALIVILVMVGVLIAGVIATMSFLLHAAYTRELDLRRENERLLARIGWEYHIANDRPSPTTAEIPNIPTPGMAFFRMKPDPRFIDPDVKVNLSDLDPSNTR